MMQDIHGIALSEMWPGTIEITHYDGRKSWYAEHNGTLIAGRPWKALAPDGHGVTFFLPFPDGQPMVLAVDHCPEATT